ncbi:MAG TPA: hypothetical protein VJ836_00755 [Candidatus Saccharimonadales bacterium]|nr:hypothetical protein [Candidatus Saccharimonadales bacterium]
MSKVSEEKRNWLEEVKADAEALTRARLAVDLPKMEQEVAARESKKKEAREAGIEHADVPPTQPVTSDGQPDQGPIGDLTDKGADSEELARLKAEVKALKSKNTKLENKLKSNQESGEDAAAPDDEQKPAESEGEKPEEDAEKGEKQ